MTEKHNIVVSASRRTDLVACFPDYLIEKLMGYPPEKVHTLVLWTKNPHNLINHRHLRKVLTGYRHLYVHLTITGLGGSMLEPRIPQWREASAVVPDIVKMLGDPRRISWRFDPIVRADAGGNRFDNYPFFAEIACCMSSYGITTCRTSWVQPYKKVLRRCAKQGVSLKLHTKDEISIQAAELERTTGSFGMMLRFCSVEGATRSRCIDGNLLTDLHPDGLACSAKRAKGQRTLCGCTESVDIGWYSLKCPNGCLYCYAEPLIDDNKVREAGKND